MIPTTLLDIYLLKQEKKIIIKKKELKLPVQYIPANSKQLYPVLPSGFCTELLGARCPSVAETDQNPYPQQKERRSCPPRPSPHRARCISNRATNKRDLRITNVVALPEGRRGTW